MKKQLLTILTITAFAFTAYAQPYALNFDGGVGTDAETQSIKYDDDATTSIMDGATDYTIEMWVKPTNAAIHGKVLLKQWNLFALTMYQDANRRFYFTRYDATGTATAFVNTNNDVLTIDEWNHIAVICDSGANTIKLYVNGLDVTNDTETAADVIMAGGNTNDNLYIGYGGTDTYPAMQARGIRIKNVTETIGSLNTTDHSTSPYTTDANTAALFYFAEGSGIVTENEASGTNGNFGFASAHYPTWVDAVLAIEDNNLIDFSVYPNPVTEKTFAINANESIKNVQIFDVLGKSVKAVEASERATQLHIDVNNLSKGIYFVKTETDAGIGTQKIIIQ